MDGIRERDWSSGSGEERAPPVSPPMASDDDDDKQFCQRTSKKRLRKAQLADHNSGSEEDSSEEQEEDVIFNTDFEVLRFYREIERERQLDLENAALQRITAPIQAEDIFSTPNSSPFRPRDLEDFLLEPLEDVFGEEGDAELASTVEDDAVPVEADEVVSGTFEWTENYETFTGVQESYSRVPGPTTSSVCPDELFSLIWDDTIMESIAFQTNNYAWQTIAPLFESSDSMAPSSRLRDWYETSPRELRVFFAILIYMSLDYRTVLDEYWTTGVLGMPEFRALMSRDRFFILLKFIHFIDNDTINSSMDAYSKKIAKVLPIVQHCNVKFPKLYTPRQALSLDESLLLWKGRLSWAQCVKTKAARIGIKSYDLCEAESGYLLRTILYTGHGTSTGGDSELIVQGIEKPTARVVLKLVDGYLDVGHSLYMDSAYNQMPLTRYLKTHKTDVVGTLDRRRQNVPFAIKELTPQNMAPGEMVWRHCGDINLVAWIDVKLVAFVSTYHGNHVEHGQRSDQPLDKPSMVDDYNRYMGGVDMKDQMLSMYPMERKRGTKWYLKVFRRLINTSILNCYIVQKINKLKAGQQPLSHRQFRYAVADGLVRNNRAIEVPRQIPPKSNRLPPRLIGTHDADVTQRRDGRKARLNRRCARCSALGKRKSITYICVQCDVGLCLGTCFREYHTLENLGPQHRKKRKKSTIDQFYCEWYFKI